MIIALSVGWEFDVHHSFFHALELNNFSSQRAARRLWDSLFSLIYGAAHVLFLILRWDKWVKRYTSAGARYACASEWRLPVPLNSYFRRTNNIHNLWKVTFYGILQRASSSDVVFAAEWVSWTRLVVHLYQWMGTDSVPNTVPNIGYKLSGRVG